MTFTKNKPDKAVELVAFDGTKLALVNSNTQLVITNKSAAGVEQFNFSAMKTLRTRNDSIGGVTDIITVGGTAYFNGAESVHNLPLIKYDLEEVNTPSSVLTTLNYNSNAAWSASLNQWAAMQLDANKNLKTGHYSAAGVEQFGLTAIGGMVNTDQQKVTIFTNGGGIPTSAALDNEVLTNQLGQNMVSANKLWNGSLWVSAQADADKHLKVVGPVHRQTDTVNAVGPGTTIDMTKAPGRHYGLFLNTLVANSAKLEISDDGVLWFGLTVIAGLGAGTLNYNPEVDKPASFIRANCTVNPGTTACTMTVVVSK